MNDHKLNRRHFLRGAGGFTLAIPFMGSLLPRTASAQPAVGQKRFIFIGSDHGGIYPENMYPSRNPGAASERLFGRSGSVPEHFVRHSPLEVSTAGSAAVISPVLSAPSSRLTSQLASKMNVIAGFDFSTYFGHHRALLGNCGSNDAGLWTPMASIDQLIAWNPTFNLVTPRERSVSFGVGYGAGSSVRFSQSAARSGGQVSAVQAVTWADELWRRLFEGFQAPTNPQPDRPLVVDRVLAQYRSLRDGALGPAARLSQTDRDRLDAHMQGLFELQRKLGGSSVSASCTSPSRPSGGDVRREIDNAVAVTAAALKCGLTHVATFSIAAQNLSQSNGWNNWHEQVAHSGSGEYSRHNPAYQQIHVEAQREIFEATFLALAEQLDTDRGDGSTYLDDTLMAWSMESGDETHNNFSTPVVTAGSAGGYFHTGRYIDLRNQANTNLADRSNAPAFRQPGTLYARFLSNAMQSMGLSPADWQSELLAVQRSAYQNGARGYFQYEYHPNNYWLPNGLNLRNDLWPEMHWQAGDDPIPGWVVGA